MRGRVLSLILPLAASGCGVVNPLQPPPAPLEWSRERMSVGRSLCRGDDCRLRLDGTAGRIDVRNRTRVYARHQIPGWGERAGVRVTRNVGFAALLGLDVRTEQVKVGLGTRTVTRDGWQLQCAVFWMHDEVQEKGVDSELETLSLRARGMECSGGNPEPGAAAWHYREGIAPTRDSLAVVYDALAAVGSPEIGLTPPIILERRATDGAVETYRVHRELVYLLGTPVAVRLHVARGDGAPLAILNVGHSLDFSPQASGEERGALRLISAALLAGVQDQDA